MKEINGKEIKRSFTYQEYRDYINELFVNNKTTGDNHSEDMLNYTKMNIQRMKRLDKTVKIIDVLKQKIDELEHEIHLMVISEAWCGDASQNLPVLNAVASLSDKINLKIILRDENTHIMDDYLTNGGASIPKMIVVKKESNEERATWGPRPLVLQQIVMDNKKSENPKPYSELSKDIQMWYNKDKGETLQREVMEIIENIAKKL